MVTYTNFIYLFRFENNISLAFRGFGRRVPVGTHVTHKQYERYTCESFRLNLSRGLVVEVSGGGGSILCGEQHSFGEAKVQWTPSRRRRRRHRYTVKVTLLARNSWPQIIFCRRWPVCSASKQSLCRRRHVACESHCVCVWPAHCIVDVRTECFVIRVPMKYP